jgi:hypothetical protein
MLKMFHKVVPGAILARPASPFSPSARGGRSKHGSRDGTKKPPRLLKWPSTMHLQHVQFHGVDQDGQDETDWLAVPGMGWQTGQWRSSVQAPRRRRRGLKHYPLR